MMMMKKIHSNCRMKISLEKKNLINELGSYTSHHRKESEIFIRKYEKIIVYNLSIF